MQASAPRAAAQLGWAARAAVAARIASSREASAHQSPPSSTIATESRSGGSASAGAGSMDVAEGELSPGAVMALGRLLGVAGLVVGLDDARYEIAAHNVAGYEPDRLDPLDAAQQPDRLLQPRLLSRR